MDKRRRTNKRGIGNALGALDMNDDWFVNQYIKPYQEAPKGTGAVVYGLRSKESNHYFYVGSSRVSAESRVKSHLSAAKSDKGLNKHLSRKIRKIGSENIICDTLEEASIENQFVREYAWITKLRSEGHNLANIKLIPEQELVQRAAIYTEEIDHKACDPTWIRSALTLMMKGPGEALDSRNQGLVDSLYKVSVLSLKRLVNEHWDEYRAKLGFTNECEQSGTIATMIKALPLPS